MSDEKNVIDFGARAAAERARRQGFLLSELDGSTVKSILDAAYIDCRLDGDGDCVVDDELRLIVTAGERAERQTDLMSVCGRERSHTDVRAGP